MRQIEFTKEWDYVSYFVDVFQLLSVPAKDRATKKNKEFLTHLVIMHAQGWNIDSSEGVMEVAQRMNFKNRDEVYNYRKALKKRGLIEQTVTGLSLIKGLQLKKIPTSLTVKFNMRLRR